MSHIWKTVRVFISSTFRDMHAERDHLVKVVFPALRERLEKHRIYLIDIDLRWGVTREQAENDQAIDLCLQQIDECRPFFVGILGERYGWVPTRFPADALKKYGWVQRHTGKSVTELEILHGVLQNQQMRGHAFFYFRDPEAIKAVPEAIRQAIFVETDKEFIDKLAELKQKIRCSGHPVMETYKARWDPEAYDRPSKSKGRLADLETFGERVRDQLWEAIQAEHQLPQKPVAETQPDPLAEEKDYHERFIDSRLRVYVGRKDVRNALAHYADAEDKFACLVTGASGSGKSAALARFVRVYERARRSTFVISHFIGASPRSTNLRDMLRRLCQALKAHFGFAEDVPEEVAKLSVTFREFIGKVPADARVLLVIDALNQLDEADRAQELFWLPTELPPQVKVIVSCITDSGKTGPVLEAFRRRKHCPIQLAALSDVEQRLIIRQVPSLSAKTLDDDQARLLLSNPATANPLFLLVALEELRGFAPYERLNERIAAFPREGDSVTAIFTQVIERLAEEFNQTLVETVLTLLASARRGLSERELQELVAGLEGADDLFPVLRQLRPYLLSRAGLIDFYHRNLLKAVRERYLPSEEQQRQAHGLLAEYFHAQDYWLESLEEQRKRAKSLPPTPRPANVRKVDELPWQLLQAADWQRSEQLLTDLAFLEAKAEAGMVFDLAADFSAVIGEMPADRPLSRILRLLKEALRRDIHFIARHSWALFQCLWNSCWWYDSPEAAAHYDLSKRNGKGPLPWDLSANECLAPRLERWRVDKERRTPGFAWLRSLCPPVPQLGTELKASFLGCAGGITSVSWSPDGLQIASGSKDGIVRIWDVASGKEANRLEIGEGTILRVAWSPAGPFVAWGVEHGLGPQLASTLGVWNAATQEELWQHQCQPTYGLAWSPDGRWIASAEQHSSMRIFDAMTGMEKQCIEEVHAESIAWSPDGRSIVAGRYSNDIVLCEVGGGTAHLCGRPDGWFRVESISWSPDGRSLAIGGDHNKLWVLDAATGEAKHCLRGHRDKVTFVAWSPSGRFLASASGHCDRSIRIWNMSTGKETHCLQGHSYAVNGVAWSPDGQFLVSGSNDDSIRIWDISAGLKQLPRLDQLEELDSRSITWSPDGRLVAMCQHDLLRVIPKDQLLQIWDTAEVQIRFRLQGHEREVTCTKWSPCGWRLASGSSDNTVRVWDAKKGKELICFSKHTQSIKCLDWSPDGRAVASSDNTVRVWEAATGAELACIPLRVECIAWSPNGRLLATGTSDCTVRIWDAETYAEVRCLGGVEHRSQTVPNSTHGDIFRVAWSSDSRLVVSWSSEPAVRVWDVDTKECKELFLGKQSGDWLLRRFQQASMRHDRGRGAKLWFIDTGLETSMMQGDGQTISKVSQCLTNGGGSLSARRVGGLAGKNIFLYAIEGSLDFADSPLLTAIGRGENANDE